jgi:Signal peptide peptidase
VSLALTLHGVVFGGFALANTLAPAIEGITGVPAGMNKEYGHKDYLLFSGVDLVSIFFAAPVAVWYFQTRSWLANNTLVAALSLSAIDLAIGDFKTSVICCAGFLFTTRSGCLGASRLLRRNLWWRWPRTSRSRSSSYFRGFWTRASLAMASFLSSDWLIYIVIPGHFVAMLQRSRLLRGHDDAW